MVIVYFHGKNNFLLRYGEQGAILGGSDTALSKFWKLFLPQILSFFGAKEHFVLKKFM